MRKFKLGLTCAFCVTVMGGNGELSLAQQSQPTQAIIATPQPQPTASLSQSSQANTAQTPASELANLETKVGPAVVWVTSFDAKGNLLRTESGFFISADGRVVTTAHAIEGAVNAVAKTADGGIYNVSGVLAESKASDLVVLKAEVKPQKLLRFLELNKASELSRDARVAVVGSALAGSEGNAREATIAVQSSDRFEIMGAIPASYVGAPVVNENGDVVGVVTSAGEKAVGRPVGALDSLLFRVTANTQARWPQLAEATATPHATPKPRLIYAPAPSFPPGQSVAGQSGTGRFRLTFNAAGNVTNVQVVASTGNPYFDQAAVKTLRQWRSAPGEGWQATVPVTFKTR